MTKSDTITLLIKYTQIIDPRHSMDNDNLGWVYILDYNQFETLINRTFHLKYSNITTLIINIPKQSCFGF
ncbi:hypothetical protein DERF_001783 [Dermatophagoides farinae]|uniref:Uncharacterized protein n=1 Tax=Dermatophagoides farinae TaxID=6954 RepID=A0A922L8Z8_DERFA|nr:hypothetical protein DERF_001783 [Dermatophagoides farinae]